jgi:hypothetical protein
MISIDTLKRLFSDTPEKQTMAFKGQCSDCECDVIIKITATSRGFGLQGGPLFEHATWHVFSEMY